MVRLVLVDGEGLFDVREEEFCEVGGGFVEEDALSGGGDFGVAGKRFAVDDH